MHNKTKEAIFKLNSATLYVEIFTLGNLLTGGDLCGATTLLKYE